MKSIKKLLQDFKKQYDLAKDLREQGMFGMESNMPNNSLRLFHFSAQMHTMKQKISFLQNVSLASGHIAYLKDTTFAPHEIPDIPDDFAK